MQFLLFKEKAFMAIDRSDPCWFEWNLRLLAALGTRYAGAVIDAFALLLHAQKNAAVRAALRLVDKAFLREKLLLTSGECEWLMTISARKSLVFEMHWRTV